MSKTKRQDFFFNKAKEEGYPARSVYKLKEIDQKYKLIKPGDIILDLGASPGSWIMYLSKKIGPRGRVVGIDTQSLKIDLKKNAEFIKGDIKDERIMPAIKFDSVVSDLSPKMSGINITDTARSLELAQAAFKIAQEKLKQGGHFLFKIFESEDANQFIKKIQSHFNSVKRYRPEATRRQSREFYVICKHRK